MSQTRRLAAILAADVAGYSRLIGADETGTLQAFKLMRAQLFEPMVARHNGRLVKTTGDGFLVEFRSVVDALRCAVDVQASMPERNAAISSDRRIEFRMGIIDILLILLWNFPLKSHFADAAEAQPQAPPVQSSEIARHPSCRRRSPAPLPSCSWTCRRRRGATHLRYPSPARPAERYPRFWPLRSDRSAHCSRRTPAALSDRGVDDSRDGPC
jgi:hypothetical protein